MEKYLPVHKKPIKAATITNRLKRTNAVNRKHICRISKLVLNITGKHWKAQDTQTYYWDKILLFV
jgi:hypothetical protein